MLKQKFQDIEESHIVQMKDIIRSYSHLIEDTHKQIGEVSAHTDSDIQTYRHIGIVGFIFLLLTERHIWYTRGI